MTSLTLYAKLWSSHLVSEEADAALIYIDRHLVQEVSSPAAFETLVERGRRPWRPESNLAVADHAVPTHDRGLRIADPLARAQVAKLEENARTFAIPYIPLESGRQGIVHVIGPELGFTLPGATLVCGDSHTSTHGAFGALAFGIGATDCETVLATQCLRQRRSKTMRVRIDGPLGRSVTSKDLALALIREIGANGAAGYAVEYAGSTVDAMSMSARMTLCNMTIEAGARIGLIAPDQVTFDYLKGRPLAPKGETWAQALAYWRTLRSDPGAMFDRELRLDASTVAPFVSWGTTPEHAAPITGEVPDPQQELDPSRRARMEQSLSYMALTPGSRLDGIEIDRVFIGSCTNGRIEDLRDAASVVAGRRVHGRVSAMVVPGSMAVKRQAEQEGLDTVFQEAGFQWRDAGCSMCVAMNDDRLKPGERCASTSNRNFEGRQGVNGRTHLMSPAMAAAAAVMGRLVDVREMA